MVVFLLFCGLHNEAGDSKFRNRRQCIAYVGHVGAMSEFVAANHHVLKYLSFIFKICLNSVLDVVVGHSFLCAGMLSTLGSYTWICKFSHFVLIGFLVACIMHIVRCKITFVLVDVKICCWPLCTGLMDAAICFEILFIHFENIFLIRYKGNVLIIFIEHSRFHDIPSTPSS